MTKDALLLLKTLVASDSKVTLNMTLGAVSKVSELLSEIRSWIDMELEAESGAGK